MKKKICLILCLFITLIGVFALASCKDEQPPEHTHFFSEWMTSQASTCFATGVEIRTCACGEKETRIVALKEHNYGNFIPEITPTCIESGTVGHYKCSNCNKYFDINKSEIVNISIPLKPHTPGEWINEVPATCTEEGSLGYSICSVCKKQIDANNVVIENVVLPPTHDFSDWIPEIPATCVDGSLGHFTCSACNKNFDSDKSEIASLKIPATKDHSFSEWGKCVICGAPRPSEGLEYTLSVDGTYYILSSYGICKDKEVVIPTKYNNLPVKEIGDRAFCDVRITSVFIPDTITKIGSYAFKDDAFSIELKKVYINDLTAWCNIEFLSSYSNPLCSKGNLYLNGACVVNLIIPKDVNVINDNAFYGCYSLTNVVIPDSVTSIGSSAFDDCDSLTSITIPHSVTSIGSSAFEDCDGLTSITIPNSVTSIGSFAFSSCNSLTSIVIPDSVTSIGSCAFEFCDSLTSVYYISDSATWCNIRFEDYRSNPLHYADNFYLKENLVTELVIPDSVASISSYAFYGCDSLTSIVIPDSVTSIGSSAFEDCDNLTNVTIGNSVTSIGSSAFKDCDSLTSIVIPDGVTSISDYAFYDCDSLTSIVIPDSVTSIGSFAFYHCASLYSIKYTGTIIQWGNITKGSHWNTGNYKYTITYNYKADE